MAKFASYPTYKPSNVSWLGDIPDHWEVWKITHGFDRIGSGTTPKSDNPMFYDGDIPWVTTSELRETFITDTAQKVTEDAVATHSALKIYPKGSLAIAMYGATIGRLGMLEIDATFNQACCVFAEPTVFDTRFVYYWLWMRRPILISLSNGGGQPNLSQDDLKKLWIPIPNIPEQQTIARFLDFKTAQIDALIAKQQSLLAKLAEKRTALISHAVTKGLDPSVPMKDSGAAWLGDIPAHWQRMSMARVIYKFEQGWSPSCDEREASLDEWGVLKSGCVNYGVFQERAHKTLPPSIDPIPSLEVHAGDILMCRASGSKHLIGSVAMVRKCRPKLIFSDKTYRITLERDTIEPEFFILLMKSKYLRDQIELSISGADGLANNIPQSSVKGYQLVLPPTIDEQKTISTLLNKKIEDVDAQEAKILEVIGRLQEYRSALITNTVTGKIDVRGFQIPDSSIATEPSHA
ncbi:restriction endonuclease subunit S [Aeromonas salmonicida]|uniref:restriction endonuclease subunit S n=1 Tax=Aeromonas salmonicida TaxID=645 RepID=UPI003435EE35